MKKLFFSLIFLAIISPGITFASPEDVSIDFFANGKFVQTATLTEGGDFNLEYRTIIPSRATDFQIKLRGKEEGGIQSIEKLKKEALFIDAPFFLGTVFIKNPDKISFLPWASW